MPTAKHRIAAYLPPEIDEKFQAFKRERGVGDSQALILILNEFLEVSHEVSHSISLDIEVLRSELRSELLGELDTRFDRLKSELLSDSNSELLVTQGIGSDDPPIQLPLTTVELAERFGCNDSLIRKQKSKYGGEAEKFIAWTRSRDPQGHGWRFDEESKSFALVVPLA
jgi:hypothetical protein